MSAIVVDSVMVTADSSGQSRVTIANSKVPSATHRRSPGTHRLTKVRKGSRPRSVGLGTIARDREKIRGTHAGRSLIRGVFRRRAWRMTCTVAGMTRAALLTTVALLAACAPMQVVSSPNRNAARRPYITYDWDRTGAVLAGDDHNRMFEDYFEGAVARRLADKGLRRPVDGAPDLLLRSRTSLRGVDVAAIDRLYRRCSDGTCRAGIVDYDEVTIAIDAIDPQTETLVWRGSANAKLNGVADDAARLEGLVDRAVTRMLQGFPGRQS